VLQWEVEQKGISVRAGRRVRAEAGEGGLEFDEEGHAAGDEREREKEEG
jgi:hypothetical protein